MAKKSFHQDKLGRNPFGLSTTGFNLNRTNLIDNSKLASSHKYGKTEIQRAHPGWNVTSILYRLIGFPPQKTPIKILKLILTLLSAQLINSFRLIRLTPKVVASQPIMPT